MKITYTGRQVELKPAQLKKLETQFSKTGKLLDGKRECETHVILSTERHLHNAEATLNYYVQKKWFFTVMKIDTTQMKRNKDGTFDGEVTPTRFSFTTDKLIYPLKITQISVREKTSSPLTSDVAKREIPPAPASTSRRVAPPGGGSASQAAMGATSRRSMLRLSGRAP